MTTKNLDVWVQAYDRVCYCPVQSGLIMRDADMVCYVHGRSPKRYEHGGILDTNKYAPQSLQWKPTIRGLLPSTCSKDGGRILFALPEVILRRRIPSNYENAINLVSFSMLLLLMV